VNAAIQPRLAPSRPDPHEHGSVLSASTRDHGAHGLASPADPSAGAVLSLPSGGGAVAGLGEKFSPDLFTGTGNLTLPLALPAKEFALLQELMRRAGETLTRTYLIEHVWDFAYDGGSNVVDVYVRYLRDKIDRPFDRNTIRTVRGAGYRLDPGR
jgi:hypothetical protein